jgi:UDP-N-acetylmuramyl pentapeptide synthase
VRTTKLRDISHLLRTPIGRRRIRWSAIAHLWPVCRQIGGIYRRTLCSRPRIVAVVGTFGKTTTTRAVAAGLGLSAARIRGWNSNSFLAFRLLRVRPFDRYGVLEAGISRIGQMQAYATMIRPDITVVTSIGSEHHTSLRTLETTRHEKAEMVRALPPDGLAILNGDDPNVRWMRGETSAKTVTFGLDEENDIRATEIVPNGPLGTQFTVSVAGMRHRMQTQLIGQHNVYPILAAIAVAMSERRPLDEVLPALEALDPAPRRLERLRSRNGALLIVDTVKSHLETIEAAIDALATLQHGPGRRIVLLGEIEEPPGSQGPVYKAVGRHLASAASLVVFVGSKKALRSLRSGLREAGFPAEAVVHAGRTPRAAVERIAGSLTPEDVVLVKGRSTQHMERAAYLLAGQKVTCELHTCSIRQSCADCPMLIR